MSGIHAFGFPVTSCHPRLDVDGVVSLPYDDAIFVLTVLMEKIVEHLDPPGTNRQFDLPDLEFRKRVRNGGQSAIVSQEADRKEG